MKRSLNRNLDKNVPFPVVETQVLNEHAKLCSSVLAPRAYLIVIVSHGRRVQTTMDIWVHRIEDRSW